MFAFVIHDWRKNLLSGLVTAWVPMLISVAVVLVLLAGGIVFFKRMERTLADVI